MSELYDLTRIGPVLSLEPVVVEYGPSAKHHQARLVHIYDSHYLRYGVITNEGDFMRFNNVKHILRKVAPAMRPMTSGEALWILTTPRCVIRHIDREEWEVPTIHAEYVVNYEYGFVNEDGSITGVGKFEKEV